MKKIMFLIGLVILTSTFNIAFAGNDDPTGVPGICGFEDPSCPS